MPYRSDTQRRQRQFDTAINSVIGQRVIWRQYVSASAGAASVAGYGNAPLYRDEVITATIGQWVLPTIRENVTPAGMIAAGEFNIITSKPIRKDDLIYWQQTAYTVMADTMPSTMFSGYQTFIKRGGQ